MTLFLIFSAMTLPVVGLLVAPLLRSPVSAMGAEIGNRRLRLAGVRMIAVMLPLGAGWIYHTLGSPQLPGQPYAQRQDVKETFALAERARDMTASLKETPDAEGYKRLAEMEFLLHNYAASADACRKAIDLGNNDAGMWAELGETLTLANERIVTPEALKAFSQAYALQPDDPQTRFYIGLAKAQAGELRQAVAIWRDLEKDAPIDAPWLGMVQ